MQNQLILLTDQEDLLREECRRIVNEVERVAMNPNGESQVVVAPVDKRQARLVRAYLTPTFFADFSSEVKEYLGQMNYYDKLVIQINRRSVAA